MIGKYGYLEDLSSTASTVLSPKINSLLKNEKDAADAEGAPFTLNFSPASACFSI